jgi:hypothetical protein
MAACVSRHTSLYIVKRLLNGHNFIKKGWIHENDTTHMNSDTDLKGMTSLKMILPHKGQLRIQEK